jgi:cellulose biosynthesis protein BcsQ
MSPDVQALVRALRAPAFRYRELRGRGAAGPFHAAPPRAAELAVAFLALAPGAGRTTLAAGVARALARRGWRTVALEAGARGDLRRQLAGGTTPLPTATWDGDPSRLLDALAGDPEIVVLDAPGAPARAVEAALSTADEAVVVVRADALALDAVAGVEALLARARLRRGRRLRSRWVVNAFDARRDRDREALRALRAVVGARLWPHPVQADEAVRAAAAAGRALEEVAPASQVVADLEALAADLAAGLAPPGSAR